VVGAEALAQQDVHFSQYQNTPLLVNPAQAGVFYGRYRLMTNYRTQWFAVSEPFTTIQASLDLPLFTEVFGDDMFAIGLNFVDDNAGDSEMSATQVNATISYGKALDSRNRHFVSLGFQGGYAQRSILYSNFLFWDSQWRTQGFDLLAPSGEEELILANLDPDSYFDFASGVHYFYNDQRLFKLYGGIAMYHLNRPSVDFLGANAELFRKMVYHIGFEHGIRDNSQFVIRPSAIFTDQGPNEVFMLGTDLQWTLMNATEFTGILKEATFGIGVYYRHKDAMVGKISIGRGGFLINATYDFTISSLSSANSGDGGPEVSLIYRGGYKKGHSGGHQSDRFK
ncbi:MAG: PorP/SprF family type IX secretion system membrane protein, partial [Bacteroidota bacterium]